eukprot:jgi/Mesvir1/14994/Mv14653-RA.1
MDPAVERHLAQKEAGLRGISVWEVIGINNITETLPDAVNKGDYDLVCFLVANGRDVNARDDIGSTPLHWAAQGGMLRIVQHLVNTGGADKDARNMPSLRACVLKESTMMVPGWQAGRCMAAHARMALTIAGMAPLARWQLAAHARSALTIDRH